MLRKNLSKGFTVGGLSTAADLVQWTTVFPLTVKVGAIQRND